MYWFEHVESRWGQVSIASLGIVCHIMGFAVWLARRCLCGDCPYIGRSGI